MYQLIRFFTILLVMLISPFHLVYAERLCQPDYPETTPLERFEVVYPHIIPGGGGPIPNNGTVTDKQTGLTWKRCLQGSLGMDCYGSSFMTWEQALQEADANIGWRLPNIKELQSIIERRCVSPALNSQVFPGNLKISVWSSSPATFGVEEKNAWYIYLGHGQPDRALKSDKHQVWLVRDPVKAK